MLNTNVYYFFPRKETLTDAGDGDGGGKQSQKNSPKPFFNIFVPLKGTLTDAGDGEGGVGKNKKGKNKFKHNIFKIYFIVYYIFCIFVYYK